MNVNSLSIPKACAALLLVLVSLTQAQSVRWQTKSESIAVNNADSVFFAFRPIGVFAAVVSPDSVAINPPDQVAYAGDGIITIRRISGNNSDSTIAYAKALDQNGRIVQQDSVFLFGTTFAAPATPNTFGDGRLYGASIGNLKKYINGVVIICRVFDLVGGTRRYEFGQGSY
jgi:hypothetical protein